MYDVNLILKDAGLVAASAAATVGGDARVLDLGPSLVNGTLVLDVAALELASNDELYTVRLQGSSKADFASDYEDLMAVEFGAAEVAAGDSMPMALFPFCEGEQALREIRMQAAVCGKGFRIRERPRHDAHMVTTFYKECAIWRIDRFGGGRVSLAWDGLGFPSLLIRHG